MANKDKNKNKDTRGKKRYKKPIKLQTLGIIVGIITVVLMLGYGAIKTTLPAQGDLTYIQFQEMITNDEIVMAEIIESKNILNVTTASGEVYSVVNPGHDEFKKELLESGVQLEIRKRTVEEALTSVASTIPMIGITFVLLLLVMRSLGGQATTLFKVLKPEDIITFEDVAGMSETKAEVEFAVSQIKNRDKLADVGARPCRGIILEGPPGTGKTLLAKAIAGEAGVPFISTSGADFVEMFVGLGAARVRALWDLASTNAPCVVFIDEIDAVGRRRSGAGDGASIEGNQTLNALLQRMDGLGVTDGIFVVAATNRISDLDTALLRPGRFDKHLYIGPPKSKKDRDEIIKVHMKKKKCGEEFDFDNASKLMFGMSGAEIEQTLNEAVLISLSEERKGIINTEDIDKASMKLRASGVSIKHTSESDRQISAIHEAGHAIASIALGRKISKVSIMPYSSGIGGLTMQDTDSLEDKKLKTYREIRDDIVVLLAGREAEDLILGDVSIGCSNDIERASILAFELLNNFAMHDGMLVNITALSKVGLNVFDTHEIVKSVNEVMLGCQSDIQKILVENKSELLKLRDRLLSEETIIDVSINVL